MDKTSQKDMQETCRNFIIFSSYVLLIVVLLRYSSDNDDTFVDYFSDFITNRLNFSFTILSLLGVIISINKDVFHFFCDLLIRCLKWIETNIISIIITLSLIFVFLYFEIDIVETSFSFIGKIKESTYGIILLWILWGILLATLIYWIIFKHIHKTLSDGRAYFVSILLCSLFTHCWTKYPWEGMIDTEIENPIAGYEWACIVLFVMFVLCFLIMPFIIYIVKYIVKSKTKKNTQEFSLIKEGTYLSDNPITSKDKDELYFDVHVQILKDKIDAIPNTGTHSIAITGGWGTGKTSFLNLLEQELKSSGQYETIWFNPMKSSKSGNIQKDFFDALENTLSKYKTGLGRRIKYYKELIGAIENKYVAFLVKLGSIQLEEEKQRINNIIKMISKKFIIIIDDVDRLKGDEIIQVFRLVGFNAEFDNVVFLIALDKGNVVNALGCGFNYPDKFFESEFPLPDNNRKATSLFVKKTLNRLLTDIQMDFLENQTITKYTNYCLSNLRDATRFINGFVDRVRMIHDKLDVCSFYLLSLIHYKSPSLYEQIKNQEFLINVEVEGKQCLVVNEAYSIEDSILNSITQHLFPQDAVPDSGPYINIPEFFDDYFNDTSTKTITNTRIMELLSSESEENLQQKLNKYANDDISKQYLIEKWIDQNLQQFVEGNCNQKRLITNYYRVFDYLKIDNGLSYHEGWAIKRLRGNKTAYIDNQGNAFIVSYDYTGVFSEDLAKVKKDDKWGFIDKTGRLAIPLEYDYADKFFEGLAFVIKDDKWGFIDRTGKLAIPLEYDYAGVFSEGLAKVKKDGKYGYIDKTGRFAIPLKLEYDYADNFFESLAVVIKDDKYGYIDKTGRLAIPLEYDYADKFFEGLAKIKKDDKYGYIDKTGTFASSRKAFKE